MLIKSHQLLNYTVALRVVIGDEKGTLCLAIQLGHSVTGGIKYRDLALQVGDWTQD
jgi:hypothetical protein